MPGYLGGAVTAVAGLIAGVLAFRSARMSGTERPRCQNTSSRRRTGEWWILAYFFFGGLSGGSYAIGTLIRLVGGSADQRMSRLAFVVSFLALLPCPIFLIADLGQPIRFINMLFDASGGGLSFKYWSPMSVGSWALLFFGIFSFVSFLGALGQGDTRLGSRGSHGSAVARLARSGA